ncbi:MAG: hypothetical protein KC586_26665, partial [Myxococcales bacterium]|nr:hypothetical protein [Myxococcales bacterium]
MRLRSVPALVVAWLVASVSGTAHARCAIHEPVLSPAPSETLPPRPLLYLFRHESMRDPRVSASAPFTVVRRERFGAIFVETLRFEATRGELRVRVGGRPPQRYQVSRRWKVPPFVPRDGVAKFVEHRWFCATLVGWVMAVDSEAAAFEVEWEGGRVVVPPTWSRAPRDEEPLILVVGDYGCSGRVVDEIPEPAVFRVFERLPNGARRFYGEFTPERALEASPPPVEPEPLVVEPKGVPDKTPRVFTRPPDLVPLVVCGAFVLLAL